MRFNEDRLPLNGHGETMAVSHDDMTTEESAYTKGREFERAIWTARDDREERAWRITTNALLSLLVLALALIANALTSRLDSIAGTIQTHSEATWQRSQEPQAQSPQTRDR